MLLVLQAHVFLGFAGRYTVYYSVYYSVYLQQQRPKKKALVKKKKGACFSGVRWAGTQFTCFTRTTVQILTPEELRGQVISLLALLVQKYQY
jgi:hypothetical protein